MTYTDGKYLVSDTLWELHRFASEVGVNREWFKDHPRHPHYHVAGKMEQTVIKQGAQVISTRELVSISNKSIQHLKQVS